MVRVRAQHNTAGSGEKGQGPHFKGAMGTVSVSWPEAGKHSRTGCCGHQPKAGGTRGRVGRPDRHRACALDTASNSLARTPHAARMARGSLKKWHGNVTAQHWRWDPRLREVGRLEWTYDVSLENPPVLYTYAKWAGGQSSSPSGEWGTY